MRLTEKENYIKKHNINELDLWNKLGQLEDIEDELGIGLDILYKLLVRGCYYKCNNEILYTFGNVDVTNKIIHTIYNKDLFFKDYGKTWALTKEELE